VGGLGALVGGLGALPPHHAVGRLAVVPVGGAAPPAVALGRGFGVLGRRRAAAGGFGAGLLPAGLLVVVGALGFPLPRPLRLAPGAVTARVLAPTGVRALGEAVLLAELVVAGWEGGAVPAQRIGTRHGHVLKLVQQPGEGAVLGGFAAPHDGL